MKAFPSPSHSTTGMDLRDYFAAAAIQGLLASDVSAPVDSFAQKAYEMADAMMKERQQNEK